MSNRRILIVDDNSDLRRLVRMSLEGGGYEFHETSDGIGALQVAEALHPRVVILDVMMPGGVDGYRVCEVIKSQPGLRSAYVILLSARGQRTDLEEGQRVGADAYLVKPFSPAQLVSLVGQVFAKGDN